MDNVKIKIIAVYYQVSKEINTDQWRIAIALAGFLIFLFNVVLLLSSSGFVTNADETTAVSTGLKTAYAQTASRIESFSTGNNTTTFSAIGQISSLVVTVQDPGFNITDAFKVILTGDWNLSVNNGSVTNFALNFLASPMDGSKPHIHQITNFKPYPNEEPVKLPEGKNLSVNGTANIRINGIVIWDNADVSISISKGNTFSFDPNDKDTDNHFGDQQVYGIVTRLK